MGISIVIPVYNEAERLGVCLDAIAAQTVMPLEVIVVDNNSRDDSVSIASSYPFVRVVHERRQGIVYARTTGFNAARGNIIGRIDGDTLLPEDWVEKIIEFYSDDNNKRLAFSGGARFYNVRASWAVSWLYNFLAFDFNHLLIGHPTLWGSNMAITTEQWRAVKHKVHAKPGIHEDLDLAMHLYKIGYGIFYSRNLKIDAYMRRVRSNRHELWEYLQWWPRTLKLHGKKSWVICWLVGSLMLYAITPLLTVGEYAARAFGRSPIYD